MTSQIEAELRERLREFTAAPFLFVGSGLSRRYYDLPNWEYLLRELSSKVGADYDEISSLESGDLPSIATRLANILHPKWFHDEVFAESRENYKEMVKTIDDVIKIETALLIASKTTFNPNYTEEVHELSKVIIDGIITTNYDQMLETIFGNTLQAFIGQESMLKSPLHRISEIYKIHGSVTEPTSLVLTSKDYERFEKRNVYLSAILTQIFVEHPIVFLGYSISDENIQNILSAVVDSLDAELLMRLSNRLIFVDRVSEANLNEGISPTTMIFTEKRIQLPVTKIITANYSEIYRPLQSFEREIPAKYLRIFKDTAHRIVLHHSPETKLLLTDLDSTNHSNNEFVFGHGVMAKSGLKGVFGLDRDDIIRDLIEIDMSYTTEEIFNSLIRLTKQPGIKPIGKYFVETGRAKFQNGRWEIEVPESFTANQRALVLKYFRNDTKDYYAYTASPRTIEEFKLSYHSVADVIARYGATQEAIKRIGWLPFHEIDTDELKQFLIDVFAIDKGSYSTAYYKLVSIYDFIKYIYRGARRPKKAVIIN